MSTPSCSEIWRLESELVADVKRGVKVRLIAPVQVNGGTPEIQQLQIDSLTALAAAGVDVHVSGPDESAQLPYMHARVAVADGKIAYLGSISLSRFDYFRPGDGPDLTAAASSARA